MSRNEKANALIELEEGEEPTQSTIPNVQNVSHIGLVPDVFEVEEDEEPPYKKARLSPDSEAVPEWIKTLTNAEKIYNEKTEPRKRKVSLGRRRRALINQFVESNNKYISQQAAGAAEF
jgi:hypothetical protein